MGFYNELDRVWVCGFPSPRQAAPGPIALIAHSGSAFGALAHNDPRLRFALAVSPGGEATATVADYILYAIERPEVKVVGLFLETARDPKGFAQALERAAARGVPVVALKVGRTEAAAAGALTHTGAIAGSDLAFGALFDRHGVIRVETLDELAATLLLLSTGRRVAPGGLVAIGDSGGEREMMIDLADRAGVAFAAISPQTKASLAARLEPGLEAANPLDAWGTGANFVAHFADCFGDLLADRDAGLGLFSADIRDGYYLHRGFADAALAGVAKLAKSSSPSPPTTARFATISWRSNSRSPARRCSTARPMRWPPSAAPSLIAIFWRGGRIRRRGRPPRRGGSGGFSRDAHGRVDARARRGLQPGDARGMGNSGDPACRRRQRCDEARPPPPKLGFPRRLQDRRRRPSQV